MVHASAPGQRAAAAAADHGPAKAPPRRCGAAAPQSKVEQLQRLSARFDDLIRDASQQATSHRMLERTINEAEEIAAGIRAVFRGPGRIQHPPLKQNDRGAWW